MGTYPNLKMIKIFITDTKIYEDNKQIKGSNINELFELSNIK